MKSVLKEIGLTDGEIKVYFALSQLGESTVGPIAKRSGVTHAKVYPIVERLILKGLASHVIKQGRKYFSAAHPDHILEYVDTKISALVEEKEEIKKLIPTILEKRKADEGVQYSRVFEGFKGLRALFSELFHSGESEIAVLGLNEILREPRLVRFFKFYHDLRVEQKIRLRLILNKDTKKYFEKIYRPQGHYEKPDEVKFSNVVVPTGVFIIGDHVVTIVTDDKVTAFDIKSKQNAERYRSYFDSVWG